MAIKYGFFNSVNGDRKYTADDIGDYLRGIIYSGVYPDGASSLQVMAAGGMTMEVQPGRAMLEFKYLENDAPYQITLSAGGTMERIDAIVAYMDVNERACGIIAREGSPGAAPVAPALIRTDSRYEVMLASVYVPRLVSEVTQANITDTRHLTEVCGWVRGAIRQDTADVPMPTPATAGYIPHVTQDGNGYELLAIDTTLALAGRAADAAATGEALAGKAPAGLTKKRYDIETAAELAAAIGDLWSNTADRSEGHFGFNMMVSIGEIYGGIWHVTAYKTNDAYGVLKVVGYNGSHPSTLYRNKMQTWGEWEWDNPPMAAGTEYRTTERYMGLPVYAKLIRVGGTTKGTTTIEHKCSVKHPLYLGVVNNEQECLTDSEIITNISADRTNIYLIATVNFGYIDVLFKYTKP